MIYSQTAMILFCQNLSWRTPRLLLSRETPWQRSKKWRNESRIWSKSLMMFSTCYRTSNLNPIIFHISSTQYNVLSNQILLKSLFKMFPNSSVSRLTTTILAWHSRGCEERRCILVWALSGDTARSPWPTSATTSWMTTRASTKQNLPWRNFFHIHLTQTEQSP